MNNISKIFALLAKSIPAPKSELDSVNEFTFLVAVVLSAQATDKGVNKATKSLFERVKTPEEMLKLGKKGLIGYIKTVGFYNSKSENIIKLSKALVERFHSKLPDNMEDLLTLPGVGRKTANVILNSVFGKPVIAVDRHVLRVANRLGLAFGDNPEDIETQLMAIVPKKYLSNAHHYLVLHGRYVCTARSPHCPECCVEELCPYENKTLLS
ncbi:MAG: endonuclease III [Alphaproteobacteria bacterium]|nr:endonuclease III [Alphaproteobacteria bacterium]